MTFGDSELSATLLKEHNIKKKQAADNAVLREDQQAALEEIMEKASKGGLINLFGGPGTGKTFLTWHLAANSADWSYHPWLPIASEETNQKVIVDNVAATRVASRRVREILTFDTSTCVVAVSREKIPEINRTVSIH